MRKLWEYSCRDWLRGLEYQDEIRMCPYIFLTKSVESPGTLGREACELLNTPDRFVARRGVQCVLSVVWNSDTEGEKFW